MNKFQAIQELEQQIAESPAYRTRLRLYGLTFAYKIFEGNYLELKKLLVALQKPEIFFKSRKGTCLT